MLSPHWYFLTITQPHSPGLVWTDPYTQHRWHLRQNRSCGLHQCRPKSQFVLPSNTPLVVVLQVWRPWVCWPPSFHTAPLSYRQVSSFSPSFNSIVMVSPSSLTVRHHPGLRRRVVSTWIEGAGGSAPHIGNTTLELYDPLILNKGDVSHSYYDLRCFLIVLYCHSKGIVDCVWDRRSCACTRIKIIFLLLGPKYWPDPFPSLTINPKFNLFPLFPCLEYFPPSLRGIRAPHNSVSISLANFIVWTRVWRLIVLTYNRITAWSPPIK